MNTELTLAELRLRVKEFATPSDGRAFFEVGLTLALFFSSLILTGFIADYSALFAILMGVPSGLLLVRIFVLQHDCGHRSLFKTRWLNQWIGHSLSPLILTPFGAWTSWHKTHHRHTGKLDVERGVGNIWLYTTEEFAKLNVFTRFAYRAYHSPIILHIIGPMFLFVVVYRIWWMDKRAADRRSIHITNAVLVALITPCVFQLGWKTVILLFVPMVFIGSIIGAWGFYTQHTFENAYFAHEANFDKRRAIVAGCSYFKLPRFFDWLTAWIGYHSIHHLNPSIPCYRLRDCWKKFGSYFSGTPTFTFLKTFHLAGLALWDDKSQKMVRFA